MTSLAERYFRPKSFEMDGRLYWWLGVLLFKRLLMHVAWVVPSRPATSACVLGGRSLDDVRQFEQRSRRSEIIHLIPLAMALAALSLSTFSGLLSVAGMLVLSTNLHCFLLQRYNRVRVYRILRRADSSSRSSAASRG